MVTSGGIAIMGYRRAVTRRNYVNKRPLCPASVPYIPGNIAKPRHARGHQAGEPAQFIPHKSALGLVDLLAPADQLVVAKHQRRGFIPGSVAVRMLARSAVKQNANLDIIIGKRF